MTEAITTKSGGLPAILSRPYKYLRLEWTGELGMLRVRTCVKPIQCYSLAGMTELQRMLDDIAALKAAKPDDGPATELLHFAIHSPRSPYGVPRWVGTLLSVLGSRQMEEVNFLYFENKSVPPMALLVSGGRISEASVPRIERFIEENLKGKANFHKILILEADGAGTGDGGRAKIELRPLTDAQQQDALFQVYDERNIDKVGSAFRLPRLLRGESKDFNRATAESALRFAEDQVFQPERDEFDFLMNRKVLADMGLRFWRFRSQTPVTRDPERMTEMVERLVRVGVLTPEEGRLLAGDIYGSTPLWGSLRILKAIYYGISLANLPRTVRAWLRRRRNIRDQGPLSGETVLEPR